jgi:VCBS repeat-containing protein
MGRKRIIVDRTEWAIDESAGQDVPSLVQDALQNSKTVALAVLDGANRQVTFYLNGRTATAVVVDLDLGAKPSEISG